MSVFTNHPTRLEDPAQPVALSGTDLLRRLLVARTVGDATQAAVDTVREALQVDVSWCGIIGGDELTMSAHSGLQTTEMAASWHLKVGEGVGGRVAKEGRTMQVRDYRRDPRRVPVMKRLIDEEHILSSICAPLVWGSQIFGILYAASRVSRDWTEEEARFITAAGRDAGCALSLINQRHREQLHAVEDLRTAQGHTRNLQAVKTLTGALSADEDIGTGITFLANQLGMHVEMVNQNGELLAEAPKGDESDDAVRLSVKLDGEYPALLRIRGDRDLDSAERELVEVSSGLIKLQLQRERVALRTELRIQSELFDDLLEGRVGEGSRILERVPLLGADLKSCKFVACIGPHLGETSVPDAPPKPVSRQAFERLERGIERHLPGSIVFPRLGEAVVLVKSGGTDLDEVNEHLGLVVEPARMAAGVGRLCLDLRDFADSYAEARMALELARRRMRAGEVLSPADLGFYGIVGSASTRPSLESLIEDALGPLLSVDAGSDSEYVKTLDAYLTSDRHLERTAKALYVHPNTVRYRLTKIEEMLGISIRDVEERFLLELALRVRAALVEQ